MNKISTIIIGLGNIGFKYDLNKNRNFIETHYRTIINSKDFNFEGAIEKNTNIKKKFKQLNKINLYKNLKQLKKNIKSINLFIVATPTKTHFKVIQNILKFFKPKIIFCEKPFCNNPNDANKILEICKKKEVKLFINYLRRVDKNILKIKKYLKFNKNNVEVYYSKDI